MATTFKSAKVQSDAPPLPSPQQRYLTLDAGRGAVMIVLVSNGLGLAYLPIESIARQFHHLAWGGLNIWDMIHPAFSFMVGASLAFAMARRKEQGVTFKELLGHAAARSLTLMVLGQILVSLHAGHFHLTTDETLTEIAVDYFGCFLILQIKSLRWQVVATTVVFTLSWGLYVLFPGPDGPFSPTGNVGVRIDRFVFGMDHSYDWPNLDQLGSLVTTMLGAWTGLLIRSRMPSERKLRALLLAMIVSFTAAIGINPISPCMFTLYTASYIFYTAGFILLAVVVFFWLFDIKGYHKLAFPFIVPGMNSIFIYMAWGLLEGWVDHGVGIFTWRFRFLGMFGPVVQAWAVFLVFWYLCYWLHRRKIFIKV